MIKMIIIIVLKLNLRVDIRQSLGHWLRLEWTQINIRIKMVIIIVLKSNLGGQSRARPGSRVRLTIDSGQHKDKNYYYHSFET